MEKDPLCSGTGFLLYLAAGNHDSSHPRTFLSSFFENVRRITPCTTGFDYAQAHFTILDNSRSDQLSDAELTFLEERPQGNTRRNLSKFIVSHRPSWLVKAVVADPEFPAAIRSPKKVRCPVRDFRPFSHEMLHAELEGVDYVSMVSAGGHLRHSSGKYRGRPGFSATPSSTSAGKGHVEFRIHERLGPGHTRHAGRVTVHHRGLEHRRLSSAAWRTRSAAIVTCILHSARCTSFCASGASRVTKIWRNAMVARPCRYIAFAGTGALDHLRL